ncbi:MAG: tetratricopeptide repeat protein [Bacteroidota bacterium]
MSQITIYERLVNKFEKVLSGNSDLLDFYVILWENGPLLKGNDYQNILKLIKQKSNESALSKCWYSLSEGFAYAFNPTLGNSFEKLNDTLEMFRAVNDVHGEGATQALLVLYYKNIGQLAKAQEFVQSAIQNINEHKSYMYFLGIAYYQGGEINHLLKDYKSAIDFFSKGHSYSLTGAGINARLLNAIGTVYRDTGELELAYDYFQKSLKLIEGENNHLIESKIYADIGNYFSRKEDYKQSLLFQEKSMAIRKENKLEAPLITNYLELAELAQKQQNFNEALSYALLAEKLSDELNIPIKKYQASLIISNIYEALGNNSLALEHFKKYHYAKDELLSQENARKIKQISMHHEMETMQKEKEIFKIRNVVLKSVLEEIEASVRYAKRIQEAILPPLNLIKEKLSECFLLYKPKDVVAGDFYWMEEINGTVLIAAADCTGHGVPGAMVSVVCSNALNRAVKEFNLVDTGAILDKVTDLVLETFEKSENEVKDGMDISLISINKTIGKIYWSGANNPLWYFNKSGFNQITADKQPIGKSDHRKPFTTHQVEYIPGTRFYLFTDGFADQFGGPKGKKFMHKQFQQLITSTVDVGFDQQKETLNTIFENWKGDIEQVDDVCIIGIRI